MDVAASAETWLVTLHDMAGDRLSAIGSLLGDETRSQMLTTLMDGRAYTSGELARSAGVSPSTASEHLRKLRAADLVRVEPHGRHRYFSLSGPQAAQLLEAVGAAAPVSAVHRPSVPAALRYARTCYDHLAGEVAVRIYDSLAGEGHLDEIDRQVQLNASGYELLAGVGVDVNGIRSSRRETALACLDWTERRHHLAGAAGAALLASMLNNGWAVQDSRPRVVRITPEGKRALTTRFRTTMGRE